MDNREKYKFEDFTIKNYGKLLQSAVKNDFQFVFFNNICCFNMFFCINIIRILNQCPFTNNVFHVSYSISFVSIDKLNNTWFNMINYRQKYIKVSCGATYFLTFYQKMNSFLLQKKLYTVDLIFRNDIINLRQD